jgi:hypothetical protein
MSLGLAIYGVVSAQEYLTVVEIFARKNLEGAVAYERENAPATNK